MKKFIIILVLVLCLSGCKSKIKDKETIKITNSGWTYEESDKGKFISYAVEIKNTDKRNSRDNIKIEIIGLDKNKKEIFKYDDELSGIGNNDSYMYAKTIKVNKKPENIKISATSSKTDDVVPNISNLSVSDIKDKLENGSKVFTGTITNKGDKVDKLMVSIIFKKGKKIIGGTYSYVYNIDKRVDYEIYVDDVIKYDNYEVKLSYSK